MSETKRPAALREAVAASVRKLPRAEWIGFREVRETQTTRYARDGKPQINATSVSHGVMAEVLVDGQFGYHATAALDEESLTKAAEGAFQQAAQASRHRLHPFTVAQRPPVRTKFHRPAERPLGTLGAREINEFLIEACQRMKKGPRIVRTGAFVKYGETEVRYVSSNGAEGDQRFSLVVADFEATAQNGNVVQRRTDGGMRGRSYQGGWEKVLTPDLWERAERVAEQALELISAPECPTGTMDLILMPDQMMLQIHESIGHPLEVDRILGDERNYAGWSFVRPDDFGRLQYGSELMNVTFDPTVRDEFASYGFDDNGVEAKREYLIQGGKLVRGLGGIESQTRSGLPGVSNARASSWNRPPIDRMANINLEPGTATFGDLVASTERGILMESNRSWSIDDFRNKFQFGCEYGQLIENGRIIKTVRNPNYRGVTVPFWRSLAQVGSDATRGVYGTPYCGKGEPNQLIRVGHASPICRFANIEVFGGAG